MRSDTYTLSRSREHLGVVPGLRLWPQLGETCPAVALTPAEQRVLHFVQLGLSNKEIASALGRAEHTIKNQVAACLRKFGVPSRARLMALLR
ncbi:MAG: helix-turn-helix transcriptional regulator [Candidatus Didemnitutus sp.]|nr:helix-turn-helix transcriptional regulator [Candidatus Didemnitutus sp.]